MKEEIIKSMLECAKKYKEDRVELLKLESMATAHKLESRRKQMSELAFALIDEISKEV